MRKRKPWFIVLLAVVLAFSVSASAFAAGGGFGSRFPGGGRHNNGQERPAGEVGSPSLNSKISFENSKVEAGVALQVLGAPKGSTYQWTITSADSTSKDFTTQVNSYTPTKEDEEKLIKVTVEGLADSYAAIYYSTLPVIYLNNTTGYYGVGEEYDTASMYLQGNGVYSEDNELYLGDIEIRLRGNSTKWRDKRPFNIKLDSKTDLLGMGNNKHWALLANDIDHTLLRNKLLYDFSGAIGMDTYMESTNGRKMQRMLPRQS